MKTFQSDPTCDTELRLPHTDMTSKGFQILCVCVYVYVCVCVCVYWVAKVSVFSRSIKSLTVSGSGWCCCHPLSGNNYANDELKARANTKQTTLPRFPALQFPEWVSLQFLLYSALLFLLTQLISLLILANSSGCWIPLSALLPCQSDDKYISNYVDLTLLLNCPSDSQFWSGN